MGEVDAAALNQGIQGFEGFRRPPYWETARENCDAAEIASTHCVLDDGSEATVLGARGPQRRSGAGTGRFRWPSDRPATTIGAQSLYAQRRGNGTRLIPMVDFRSAYWLGRWTRTK